MRFLLGTATKSLNRLFSVHQDCRLSNLVRLSVFCNRRIIAMLLSRSLMSSSFLLVKFKECFSCTGDFYWWVLKAARGTESYLPRYMSTKRFRRRKFAFSCSLKRFISSNRRDRLSQSCLVRIQPIKSLGLAGVVRDVLMTFLCLLYATVASYVYNIDVCLSWNGLFRILFVSYTNRNKNLF